MTPDFDAAEERARIAAFDLAAAANEVIRRRSISWTNARTDADDAEVSRWVRYVMRWFQDEAQNDLGIADRARTEVATIATTHERAIQSGAAIDATAEGKFIRRLTELAADCEKRAIRHRS